ncbi:MAG TPA: choice-of-anchor D domain-containing protein [Kofleriaceae bacterium]|nr:choice-of-anchor D domain-containing protein [Kofleriaceae bacterium]
MRRYILLVALGACSASPAISEGTQELVGAPSGTPTFPNTQVGQTSAAQTYYIYETTMTIGVHTDTISSIAYSCPDFTVNWAAGTTSDDCVNDGCGTESIAPGSSQGSDPDKVPYLVCPLLLDCEYDTIYSFTATFHPTVAAAVSCVLTITSTSGTQTYTLSGTGTAPPIHVTVSPASIGFGGVRTGSSSTPVAVTIANSGGSTATVSSVSVPSGFAIQSGPSAPFSVGSGSSQMLQVVCDPPSTGSYGGNMTIVTNDPITPTFSIPVSCTGITSTLAVSPSPAVIPTTRVGEPVQQTIEITNMGGASTTIQDVIITGVDTVNAPANNTPLAANGSTQAVVSFPATMAGPVSGNMHIDYDSGKSVDVAISGNALATSMSLTPDGDVDFGPVCAGQSAMRTFDVIANQAGPFVIQSISTPDAPFTVAAPSLPASVQGNAANTVSFMVTAAPTTAGPASSAITITTDIPNGQPDTITVDVTGLPAGVSATPTTLDLGPVPVSMTTLGQSINITNCGTTSINVSSATITGMDADAFAIVMNPASSSIDPAASAAWLIVMNASTPGQKQATFEVDYDGGSQMVPLTGEPFMPGGDGSGSSSNVTEKSSYYACNAGGAAALWPLALAFGVLVVRRRRRVE